MAGKARSLLFAWIATVSLAFANRRESIDVQPRNDLPEEYELLRADGSWCGPRCLYLFARLYGKPCTLHDVVAATNATADGAVSLGALAAAGESLGVDCTAAACSSSDLFSDFHPAIVSLLRDRNRDDLAGSSLHFVALVCQNADGRYWIVDPSRSTSAILVNSDWFDGKFAGTVLFFGDSGNRVLPWWVVYLGRAACVVLGTAATALGVYGYCQSRRFVSST